MPKKIILETKYIKVSFVLIYVVFYFSKEDESLSIFKTVTVCTESKDKQNRYRFVIKLALTIAHPIRSFYDFKLSPKTLGYRPFLPYC